MTNTVNLRRKTSVRGLRMSSASLLLSAAALGLAASAAHGQAADPAVQVADDDIIVTAQKRAQNILDVPIAINAFSEQKLERAGITELGQLQTIAPNFQISDNVSVRTIYIRGVGGGGRTVAFDTRTGVYLDGVYIGQPTAADAVLINLERVEVLRGPQGTLFGQNTVSGAVNLVTRPPSNEIEAKAIASYGNKDAVKLVGSFNVPIVDDKVLLRVGGSYEHRNGFIRNVTLGKYVDDVNNASGRAQLRLIPSDTLTIDLSADYAQQLSHKVNGEARTNTFNTGAPTPPADQPFVTDDDYPERDYNRNWGAAITITKDLDWGTLTAISGYRNGYRNWNVDLDHSAADFAIFNYYDHYRTLSQELRLNGKTGNLTYVAGLFYLNNKGENDRNLTYSALAPLLGVPAFSKIRTDPSVDNSSYAAFAAADYEFLPRLTLNAGIRFNHEVKQLTINQESDIGPPITNIAVLSNYRQRYKEDSVSPTIGVTWKPADDTMVYAKYARGNKAGGFNADYLNTTQIAGNIRLGKEKVDSYEVGLKYRTPDRVFTFSGDMFYASYNGYQVSQFRIIPNSTPPQIELALNNAGKVVTYGPEASVSLAPLQGLTIDLQAAWLHAVYKQFLNGGGLGIDYSGNRLEYAPKVTASATVDYEHPINERVGGFGHVNVSYHGEQYSDSSNAAIFHQSAYTLVDARVGVRLANGKWEIAAFSNNMLNKFYDLGTAPDAFTTIFGKYGTPRTFGLEVKWAY